MFSANADDLSAILSELTRLASGLESLTHTLREDARYRDRDTARRDAEFDRLNRWLDQIVRDRASDQAQVIRAVNDSGRELEEALRREIQRVETAIKDLLDAVKVAPVHEVVVLPQESKTSPTETEITFRPDGGLTGSLSKASFKEVVRASKWLLFAAGGALAHWLSDVIPKLLQR